MEPQDKDPSDFKNALATSRLAAVLETMTPGFKQNLVREQRADQARARANAQVANLLKNVRKKSKIKQKDLAKAMGVKQSGISRLETTSKSGSPNLSSLTDHLAHCGYQLEVFATPFEDSDDGAAEFNAKSVRNLFGLLGLLDICYLETNEDDVIVASNDAWKELHRPIEAYTHGAKYFDFLNAGLDKNLFPGARNDPDWLERRLELHHDPQGAFEIERQEGVLLEVRELKKPCGGVVTVSKDVSYKRMMRQYGAEKEAMI